MAGVCRIGERAEFQSRKNTPTPVFFVSVASMGPIRKVRMRMEAFWNIGWFRWGEERFERPRIATRGVSEVWQGKDLREGVFGSVTMAGLTGEFSEV